MKKCGLARFGREMESFMEGNAAPHRARGSTLSRSGEKAQGRLDCGNDLGPPFPGRNSGLAIRGMPRAVWTGMQNGLWVDRFSSISDGTFEEMTTARACSVFWQVGLSVTKSATLSSLFEPPKSKLQECKQRCHPQHRRSPRTRAVEGSQELLGRTPRR